MNSIHQSLSLSLFSLLPNPMDSLEGICPSQFFCPIRVEALTSAHCGHGSLASLASAPPSAKPPAGAPRLTS